MVCCASYDCARHFLYFRNLLTIRFDVIQVENTDNDRLSFIGRATIDYALATSTSSIYPDEKRKVDQGLAKCAHAYDIVKSLNVSWRGVSDLEVLRSPTSPTLPASPKNKPIEHRTAITPAEATRLMEAYVGAVVLESEAEGLKFAKGLVRAMFSLDTQEESIDIQSLSIHEPAQEQPPPTLPNESSPPPGIATGQLHDLASQHGIQLDWKDHAEGPEHARNWTSDVTLKEKKTGRTWPCVARGMGRSKKLARADAAIKVLLVWGELGFAK